MTATVETVAEQLDMAAIMPAEKVVTAVARSITLTETETGTFTNDKLRPRYTQKCNTRFI